MSIPTITFPVLSSVHIAKKVRQPDASRWAWRHDRWMIATIVTATLASFVSWYYFYSHHDTLLIGDSRSHLDIARRVFDSITPGLGQLGGVWLPLPHLIMLPLIWNDTLWRDGLAGSFTSMASYIGAAMYLYLGARRLTKDGPASYVGALVLILNPNMLYLSSTPLTEPILICTMMAACYYFLAWAQEDQLRYLTLAAAATFFATLARYDGWALYLACLAAIIAIGWRKRQSFGKIQGNVLLFATLGGLGIALWFLWCALIFKDPLYFQRGPYSSQTQQKVFIDSHQDLTYHNLWRSIHDYFILAAQSVGPVLLISAIAALVILLLRNKLGPESWVALVYCVPFAFYVVSLYGGQGILYTFGARLTGQSELLLFNTRYGTTIVAPVGLLIATLVMRWPMGKLVLICLILGQTLALVHGGIITLQEGKYGSSCVPPPIDVYLAQYYHGGDVLKDTHVINGDFSAAGISLKHVIFDGSGALWQNSLADPARYAEWVVVAPGDQVSQAIDVTSNDFLGHYVEVVRDSLTGQLLFHRRDTPLIAPRPVPAWLQSSYFQHCT